MNTKRELTEDQKTHLVEMVEEILNEPVVGDAIDNCVYCGHVHPNGDCACGCTDYD